MADRQQVAHGEYKVPGGKLVVADLELSGEDPVIGGASINGDFFLEPDEALGALNESVVGLRTDASRQTIAEAVRAGLPEGTAMIGFDEAAVATAVRRALGHATRWEDHRWEVLPAVNLPIALNVALDQVLTEEVGAGRRPPLMRLWDWSERAVVIGSFQSLVNEVDAESVAELDAVVVRRVSGGGAMYMESGNCITYSLCFPQSLVDGLSFADSYPFLDSWVMEALEKVGVRAVYKPLNDIVSAAEGEGLGRKIGGAAQKRLANGGMLHHVTMSYDIDAERMTSVLRIGREKLSDKGHTSAVKRVDPLRSQTGLARQQIMEIFAATFTERHGAEVASIRPHELERAQTLVAEKFGTQAWTARVP
ncbi:lipoate--protein ligase family protein [Nesterenkonia muleiensis]|uniref:lipoate--protein ligase family protein n=1 Tax=Nesterenkonia muleiensis TaxID=2282648 RepID=UPI000E76B3AB|nr:biotin/lipoate A/B protein ligase family protein [Nesterenkonia muleiensis]